MKSEEFPTKGPATKGPVKKRKKMKTHTTKAPIRTFLNVLTYLVSFLFIQVVITAIVALALYLARGHAQPMPAAIVTALGSVATIAIFLWRRWSPFSRAYIQTRPWAVLAWTALLTLGCVPLSMFVTDVLGVQLSPEAQQALVQTISHPAAFLIVGILVPVAEEMVFRGAILRALLASMPRRWHWGAIFISALLFAVVHGNWAQGANALLMGLLLGWLYWRSGSIAPGILFHAINNSISVGLFHLMPGTLNMRLIDFFGGDTTRLALFIACALCVAVPSLLQLRKRM